MKGVDALVSAFAQRCLCFCSDATSIPPMPKSRMRSTGVQGKQAMTLRYSRVPRVRPVFSHLCRARTRFGSDLDSGARPLARVADRFRAGSLGHTTFPCAPCYSSSIFKERLKRKGLFTERTRTCTGSKFRFKPRRGEGASEHAPASKQFQGSDFFVGNSKPQTQPQEIWGTNRTSPIATGERTRFRVCSISSDSRSLFFEQVFY